MSKEIELIKDMKVLLECTDMGGLQRNADVLIGRAIELLAQPEQTEPVAWITEWVQRYRHNDTPIIDRTVSFTKGDAPAVPNPNYIPLYTSPPKREPEQEPVAWMYCWDDEHERTYVNLLTTNTEHKHLKTAFNVMPLYTTPPKREPLSDDEIVALWANKSPANEFECVRLVEKAHGIGGGYL